MADASNYTWSLSLRNGKPSPIAKIILFHFSGIPYAKRCQYPPKNLSFGRKWHHNHHTMKDPMDWDRTQESERIQEKRPNIRTGVIIKKKKKILTDSSCHQHRKKMLVRSIFLLLTWSKGFSLWAWITATRSIWKETNSLEGEGTKTKFIQVRVIVINSMIHLMNRGCSNRW